MYLCLVIFRTGYCRKLKSAQKFTIHVYVCVCVFPLWLCFGVARKSVSLGGSVWILLATMANKDIPPTMLESSAKLSMLVAHAQIKETLKFLTKLAYLVELCVPFFYSFAFVSLGFFFTRRAHTCDKKSNFNEKIFNKS